MTITSEVLFETSRGAGRAAFALDLAIQGCLDRAAQRRADCLDAVHDLSEALGHSRRATAEARAEARRLREEREILRGETAAADARIAALEAALRLAAARIHQLQA